MKLTVFDLEVDAKGKIKNFGAFKKISMIFIRIISPIFIIL